MRNLFTHRAATFIAGAAVFGVLAGTGNAVAAKMIDSGDVENNSLKSVDIQDGTLGLKDMNGTVDRRLRGAATLEQLEALAAAIDARLDALEADDEAGANTNFTTQPGAVIVDENTVRLTEVAGSDPGTAVEIANLDVPVQAGQSIQFTYELADGAAYTAGAPRIYFETQGKFFETHDANPADKGVDNGDGTFTKTFQITQNGRVGAFGVVYDNGVPGTVTVTDVKVGTYQVKFK